MSDFFYHLAIIIFLLILSSLISTFKNAILLARKSELEDRQKQGDLRAVKALKLGDDEKQLGLTGQILNTVFFLSIAVFGSFFFCDDINLLIRRMAGSVPEQICSIASLLVFIFVAAPVNLLMIETLPRKIAENAGVSLALTASPMMALLVGITSPFRYLFGAMADLTARLARSRREQNHDGVTEEKIIEMIDEATQEGEFSRAEQALIKSVFEFSDTTAMQCMTPRTDISAVSIEDPIEKIMAFVRSEGYSRYPVYRGDFDHIIGVLFSRDIVNLLLDNKLFTFQDLIRPAYFVPDSKKISEVLADFQSKQVHMAIVLDEFGGTAGIITIEDIIEEIVGEIQDEYDEEEALFKRLRPNLVEVNARMDVDDFNERFQSDLPEDQADTIGGLIFTVLGELPLMRQRIKIDSIEFQVLALDGNRIDKVLARKLFSSDDKPGGD
jgi:CBS domain containing-hemolysin-like protein